MHQIKVVTRLKKSRKVLCNPELGCNEEDLRFGTPEIVAKYRAKRLKCKALVEIGAGVGFQTVEFAKTCKKVYAIEVNQRKFDCLLRNIHKLRLDNVTLINGDGLDEEVIKKVADSEIVFVDTERMPMEAERRLETLKPDIREILKKYSFSKGICTEAPPQIENISLECEKEYVSLYGQLNRLNLYFGKLRLCDKRIILLPENIALESDPKLKLKESGEILDYIYEINPAVIKAGMVGEVSEGKLALYTFKNKKYFTSKRLLESAFLKSFKVVKRCKFEELSNALKSLKAGRIILRGPIEEARFIGQTRELEKGLNGKLVFHVFMLDEAIVCELL